MNLDLDLESVEVLVKRLVLHKQGLFTLTVQ